MTGNTILVVWKYPLRDSRPSQNVVPPAKAEKNGFRPSKKTGKPVLGLLIINMSFSCPTEDTTLKLKVARSVLIKIKNQPEKKPENLMIICLFLSAGVWQ